eukprot:6478741-Amphidinium_carterae.3
MRRRCFSNSSENTSQLLQADLSWGGKYASKEMQNAKHFEDRVSNGNVKMEGDWWDEAVQVFSDATEATTTYMIISTIENAKLDAQTKKRRLEVSIDRINEGAFEAKIALHPKVQEKALAMILNQR